MIDDLASLKAASIGRCVSRACEEYPRGADTVATAYFRQKTTPLGIGCACEATLNMGQHLIHRERLYGLQIACDVLMIVPTLPRGHAAQPLLRLYATRADFSLPRWSVGSHQNITETHPMPYTF